MVASGFDPHPVFADRKQLSPLFVAAAIMIWQKTANAGGTTWFVGCGFESRRPRQRGRSSMV